MKKIILSLVISFLSSHAIAQTAIPFDFIDIGGVRAIVHANGQLFQDIANVAPSYEVPKGSGNHAIFASTLWMSSQEIRNNVPHYAAAVHTYGSTYPQYYQVGPVDIINQARDTTPQFQRLWKVLKIEVDNHIANWNTSGYIPPASILDWPGNGNANTAKILAPFMDLDNDSIYEPLNGEYPIIKGDQAIYTISNTYFSAGDSLRNFVRDSSGMVIFDNMGNPLQKGYASLAPMKIETHMMVYAFATNNLAVSNSVFINVKLFNRSSTSQEDLADFRLSVFADFDAGNAGDDYIGTNALHNMFYTYNGDGLDDGTRGYGNNLPGIGVKFLDRNLSHSMYFNNGNSPTGDPTQVEHYLNYQRGKWKDGQDVFYSGDGYMNCVDTNRTTNFVFDGDPGSSSMNQWTEVTPCVVGANSTPNAPGDRRMIGGPDLPRQFNHGTSIEFDYAYVFAQSTTSNTDAVTKLVTAGDSVQSFFDNNVVTGLQAKTLSKVEFSLSPNPANQSVNVDVNNSNYELTIFDISGSLIGNYKNVKSIDVSTLSKGIYFFQIRTESQIATKKLIVTN